VETAEEAAALLISLLEGEEWGRVWRVWTKVANLLSQEEQEREEDRVTQMLTIYCKFKATTKEGIFVMTMNCGELSEVCSKLMDLSLQLLASVKALEKSLSQRGRETPCRIESSL